MSNVLIKGILPAFISPVNSDGSIRKDVARKLASWQLSQGANGFYVCGSTGEGILMKENDRKELLETIIDENKGRGKVIAHIGAANMQETLELARHAKEAGADAVSSVPPIYFKYGEKEVYDYYDAISDASGLPVIMYCIALSGFDISAAQVERFMKIENMIGLKWTYPNYYTMSNIKMINDGDINVINGPDETLMCGLLVGADAGIGSTYNIMPKLYRGIYDAMQSGDINEARKLQKASVKVINAFNKTSFMPALRAVLESIGFDTGDCNPPMRKLTLEEKKAAVESVKDIFDFERQLVL